jgi:putative MATE family efflux protein
MGAMANGVAQIRRSVMTLALPVTVSSLLQRTEGIVAVFLVGGLGAVPIAAVGLGQLLAFIAATLVSGLSVGTNVVIAQLWGARRHEDAGQAARHFLGLSVLVSAFLMLLGIVLNRTAMTLLGAEPDVIAVALPYSTLIFLVIPFTVFLQVLSSLLQGTGDTRTPMYAMILVNLLHIAIAYPLIYGRWGFPAFGVKGAAVAVGIAETIGTAFLLYRCRPLLRRSKRLRWDLLRTIWHIGAPVSGERIVQQAGILVYTKIVLIYGTVSYAAHQVGLSIESLSFLPGYGFAIAAATMVGQSIGAGKYTRAKLENWEANRMATFVMSGMGIVFFFFPYALLRAFTNDESVIDLGTVFLKIVALLQIPLALTMVLAGSLRGAGDTRFIMIATMVGMWAVRVPIAFVVGIWLQLGVIYVWLAMIADWTLRMVLMLWRYRSERWKAIQVIR